MDNFYIADAFTNKPFYGNPAGIYVESGGLSDTEMQQIASEVKLSETAFLDQIGDCCFSIRWFTPKAEVDLCGHATLASAHILWELAAADKAQIHFTSKSGDLFARKEGAIIYLDFPAEFPSEITDLPKEIAASLDVPVLSVSKSRLDYIVETDSQKSVVKAQPDQTMISHLDRRRLIITSKSFSPNYDFVSRCFYPKLGVYEDPVTGSAHCQLAPYWADKMGKTSFKAIQLSSRQGQLSVRLNKDRCEIGGQAVTVLSGNLLK
ncbi:PhzF family phenazine biosynthesis protein [Sporolactobacillus terrae]|uniref:Putative isomerase n=1 Tax=Sporolactobacillus terrae TaxID=269673 RepID=A0A5K7WZN7_9BACL|nr:PhzF family phenazine biosynthesis protein [Sporolactobacillus terrae]BBN99877.1 putative isomerase [Sporolactobacillus terrae]